MQDVVIERAIRRGARQERHNSNATVNSVRKVVEQELGLDEDYLKSGEWKEKSKSIITKTFDTEEDEDSSSNTETGDIDQVSMQKKRRHDDEPQNMTELDDDSTPPKKKTKLISKVVPPATKTGKKEKVKSVKVKAKAQRSKEIVNDSDESVDNKSSIEDEESDVSVVKDEPMKKKTKKKAEAVPLTADQETIKTIQSQLVKCGIRKLWHRELASYKNDKDKIKHLKKMLEGAGMTGRFSNEKAQQIKEARELAADLEDAQQFSRTWGTSVDAEEKPGRTKALRRKRAGKMIDDHESDTPPAQGGISTGLVDFGDSGDDDSDFEVS